MVGWRIALWAVIVVAALAFLYLVRGILLPFILAFLLSALLDPVVKKLRLRGMSRPAAVWTVMLSFVGIAVVLSVLLLPTVARQIGNVREEVTVFSNQIIEASGENNFFVSWNPRIAGSKAANPSALDQFLTGNRGLLEKLDLPTTEQGFMTRYVEPYKKDIAGAVSTFFSGVFGFILGFGSKALLLLFTPIFTLFILLDLERFKQRSTALIPPSIRRDTISLLEDIGDVFSRYLRGVATVLFYYFVCAAVLLSILGAPYSVLLALIFALVYLIPYIGPVIIALLLFLVTMLSGTPHGIFGGISNPAAFAVTITIVYVAVMMVFDQLVYTRVVGRSVGLHPVISFFVVFSGGALFGPIGMILGFPVAGSIKVILDRLFRITSKDQDGLELPAVPLRHRAVQPS